MEIDHALVNASLLFGLKVGNIRRDIEIAGSPERCELRFVVEDANNRLYVIESVFDEDVAHKQKIINTLNFFHQTGLSGIQPYIRSKTEQYIVRCMGRNWQLMNYLQGVRLDRPAYVFDKWRGNILADFLIDLRRKSKEVPYFDQSAPFSLKLFIRTLLGQIKRYEPALHQTLQPVVRFLDKRFMAVYDNLPVAFCHGDYHPLNIIWGTDSIVAVIDWEFLGFKPEIYDMANLIGCIGVEDPQSLTGALVVDFIQRVRAENLMSDLSRRYFFDFVVAIRFAWLSEWLRNQDKEMIELETVYMKLLIDHSDFLKNEWGF